jgi:hypothetical protein
MALFRLMAAIIVTLLGRDAGMRRAQRRANRKGAAQVARISFGNNRDSGATVDVPALPVSKRIYFCGSCEKFGSGVLGPISMIAAGGATLLKRESARAFSCFAWSQTLLLLADCCCGQRQ